MSAPLPPVVNAAAYRFAPLSDLRTLRAQLTQRARELALRGTILLSPEGVNLFIAGEDGAVEALLASLREVPGLAALTAKYSRTQEQPFRRMLVRIKREIIAFGVPGIEPARHTSPRLAPRELRQWIEEGRRFTLLDTRNDYEVKLGTFRGAQAIGVRHFREFPAAVARLPEALKHAPVVTFCTGGIRCEKAAPFLESQGFREVYQLDGGILRYFEECGDFHYDGDCFVFDRRVGVDARLEETSAAQCFRCLAPLTAAERDDPRYVPGESCPHCHQPEPARHQALMAQRQARVAALVSPLPGSVPADNFRPVSVPQRLDGATLQAVLQAAVHGLPPGYWEAEVAAGNLLDDARQPVALARRVRAGERYLHRAPLETEPAVRADIRLLHEDESLVVLDKPAPLPVHPSGRYRRNTLQHLLHELYRPQKPRAVHRLDAETSGLVVVARTRHVAALLHAQFASGEVEKEYLVRVAGHPADAAFECEVAVTSEPGPAGTRSVDAVHGLPARTAFTVLARLADGTSLLRARPFTGRTHQIRLHCAHLGWPVCGDRLYGGAAPAAGVRGPEGPPLCLHAWRIGLRHPLRETPLRFEAPPPHWARVAGVDL